MQTVLPLNTRPVDGTILHQDDASMNVSILNSNGSDRTQEIGMTLGKLTQNGDLILLSGDLGSGKTCFTQGIARGLGIKEHIVSPTFVLIREYYGRLTLYHIDLYRLSDSEEIQSTGLEDYLCSDGICVIEWAEKYISILPQSNLLITLKYVSLNERTIIIQSTGIRYEYVRKRIDEDFS